MWNSEINPGNENFGKPTLFSTSRRNKGRDSKLIPAHEVGQRD